MNPKKIVIKTLKKMVLDDIEPFLLEKAKAHAERVLSDLLGAVKKRDRPDINMCMVIASTCISSFVCGSLWTNGRLLINQEREPN